MVALAPAVGLVAAADVVVQYFERQRHQHGAAVAVHDGLGQPGGAAGVHDPQRVVKGQPQRLKVGSLRLALLQSIGQQRGAGQAVGAAQLLVHD